MGDKQPTKPNPPTLLERALVFRDDIARFFGSQRVKHPDQAMPVEDKIQEVYVTVAERSDSFHEQTGDVKKWTLGIAANHEREAERAQKRHDARFSPTDDEHDDAEVPELSPELQAHYRDLHERMMKAFKKLPAPYLAALYLVAFEELTYEEVAKELGISVSLAKKRVERARAFLRKEVGVTREDMNSAMPMVRILDGGEVPLLERLHRFIIRMNGGGNALGVIAIGLFAFAQPAPEAEQALTGLHSIHLGLGMCGPAAPMMAPKAEPPLPDNSRKSDANTQNAAANAPPTRSIPRPPAKVRTVKRAGNGWRNHGAW